MIHTPSHIQTVGDALVVACTKSYMKREIIHRVPEEDSTGQIAYRGSLQHGKVRHTVCRRRNDLAVNDRRPCVDAPGVRRDLLEARCPIMTAPGEDLHSIVCDEHLDAIAVEFDLVNPARRNSRFEATFLSQSS